MTKGTPTRFALLLVVACAAPSCRRDTPERTVTLDEVAPRCPPEGEWLDRTRVVAIDRAGSPARPDAIGLWHMDCPPGESMPGGHYGVPSFVWDGRYVTMIMPDADDAGESAHRVPGHWEGEWLSIEMPNGGVYVVGRFVDGRFQQERRGEVIAYRRSRHPTRDGSDLLLTPPPPDRRTAP